jgi:GT2 family glycosyltransferase
LPDLSVIIINWNTRDLLIKCLRTLYDTVEELDYEIIVVDNASTDDSLTVVREHFPQVRLVENDENVGFAKANNQAMDASQGRYMLLLNSDAFVTSGALEVLVHLADSNPQAGIVGAHLLNPNGSFQASHTAFPHLWQEFLILSSFGRILYGSWYPSHGPEEAKGPQVVDYVEGACLLVRREAYEDVGGLDEGYFMYAEEVDWCYVMQKNGWEVWYQPLARVTHLGGGSSQHRRPEREADLYRSRVRFFRKHYGNTAAQLLVLQLYIFTAIKNFVHTLLRLLSGGRYGRPVVSVRYLALKLRQA